LYNLNKHFLFIVFIVVVIVIVIIFAFVFASILFFIIFALTLISFALTLIFFVFLIFFLFVIILFASFAFSNLFFNYNIERICELKKLKLKLTIYNNCLILLLRICFRIKSFYYIFSNNKLRY